MGGVSSFMYGHLVATLHTSVRRLMNHVFHLHQLVRTPARICSVLHVTRQGRCNQGTVPFLCLRAETNLDLAAYAY